jgi:hypothetical protein
MKTVTTTSQLLHSTTESNSHLFDDWFDPIETGIRDRVRGLIEEMVRGELDCCLSGQFLYIPLGPKGGILESLGCRRDCHSRNSPIRVCI